MGKWPILLLVRELGHGGCERDATKLAIALKHSIFEPHVASFHKYDGSRAQELEAAGIPVLYLPVRSFLNRSAVEGARVLKEYVQKHGIVLIHAFDVAVDLFAAFAARHYIPVLITAQLSFRDMYSPAHRLALRVSDRLADSVVVNSRAVGESLQRRMGFPAEKLYLCYNGVDAAVFYPGPGVRPKEVENAELLVGSVCVLRQEKRIAWLLESFAEVRDAHPGLRLLVVGNGPEVPRLMELRDRLGLAAVCHFEPGRPDVADLMRAIDIYVNASSSESFPNAVLEAMACGCCVVGSSVGGIPELIQHGENGFLFNSQDRTQLTKVLLQAIQDRSLRERVRRQAAETALGKFSMKVTTERMSALYEDLLTRRGVNQLVTSAAC